MFTLNVVVPTPSVTVTAPNTQTVGQPLTLTCNAMTVRGITSQMELIWTRDRMNLRTIIISPTTNDNATVYSDSYTIPLLNVDDDGRDYQCGLTILTSPSINVNHTITLNVAGMYIYCNESFIALLMVLCITVAGQALPLAYT